MANIIYFYLHWIVFSMFLPITLLVGPMADMADTTGSLGHKIV